MPLTLSELRSIAPRSAEYDWPQHFNHTAWTANPSQTRPLDCPSQIYTLIEKRGQCRCNEGIKFKSEIWTKSLQFFSSAKISASNDFLWIIHHGSNFFPRQLEDHHFYIGSSKYVKGCQILLEYKSFLYQNFASVIGRMGISFLFINFLSAARLLKF